MRPHLLHLLREQTGRDIFYVFSSEYHARRAAEAYVYPEGILLPAPQAELRPVEAQSAEVRHARVQALDRLHQKGGIVFASIESLLARMRPPEHFFAQYVTLREGQTTSPQELLHRFSRAGYEYTSLIEGAGQISGRGEMVEIFPPGRRSRCALPFLTRRLKVSVRLTRIRSVLLAATSQR